MLYTQLRAFRAVAVEGGFTRAAARLGVTQPTLSAQVKALEERCGTPLLDRRPRGVTVTEFGRRLLDLAQRLADLEAQAADLIGDARALRAGRLRVAADSPFHGAPLLAAFHRAHPGIRATLSIGNAATVREALDRHAADVAILADPAPDPALHTVLCGAHRIALLMPRGHAWAGRARIPLAALDGLAMVLREPGSTTRRLVDAALLRAGVRPAVAMEIESREAVSEAVAAGIGLAAVSAAEMGADRRLVAVPLDGDDLVTREFVVCLAERRHAAVVRAFLALVPARLPDPADRAME